MVSLAALRLVLYREMNVAQAAGSATPPTSFQLYAYNLRIAVGAVSRDVFGQVEERLGGSHLTPSFSGPRRSGVFVCAQIEPLEFAFSDTANPRAARF